MYICILGPDISCYFFVVLIVNGETENTQLKHYFVQERFRVPEKLAAFLSALYYTLDIVEP